jgi:hypothetical protein
MIKEMVYGLLRGSKEIRRESTFVESLDVAECGTSGYFTALNASAWWVGLP